MRQGTIAKTTHDPNIAYNVTRTAQASVNHVNNVATGRSPNAYAPYDINGNATSYYNSSRQEGKTPSPDAPRVEDVSGEAAYYCDREDKDDIEYKVREAVDNNLWLRLLMNSGVGVNGGFGVTGQLGVSFAIDVEGNIYALITAGAGGGLGISGNQNKQIAVGQPGASGSISGLDVTLVPSEDFVDGWGTSIGGTVAWFNANYSQIEKENRSFTGGINGYGLEFHANITYTWAIKIGEVDVS